MMTLFDYRSNIYCANLIIFFIVVMLFSGSVQSGWFEDRANEIKKLGKDVGKAVDDTFSGGSGEKQKPTQSTANNSNLNRKQIRELQSRLNSLGYSAGAADGIPGKRTYDAIRKYEQDNGLVVTGLPSKNVLSSLRSQSASTAATTSQSRSNDNSVREGGVGASAKQIIVPGTDLFKPITLPTLNNIPLIVRYIHNRCLNIEEKLYLRLLGFQIHMKDCSLREYTRYKLDSDVDLLIALNDNRINEFGKCYKMKARGKRPNCILRGSPNLLGRANEFEHKRAVERFKKEVLPKFNARGKSLGGSFYLSVELHLGKYNFDSQKVSLSTGDGGAFRKEWGYILPKSLSLSPEKAERLKNSLKTKSTFSKPVYIFGLIKFTVDSSGNVHTREIKYYKTKSYKKLIATLPLVSNEQKRKNLKASREAKKAEQQRGIVERQQQAENKKQVFIHNYPKRKLRVLGIELGVSASKAKEVLKKAGYSFDGRQKSRGLSTHALSRTPCAIAIKKIRADIKAKGLTGKDAGDYEKLQVANLSPGCIKEVYPTFKLSFTASKTYNTRLKDAVTIIVSGLPSYPDRVVAIERELTDRDGKVDFHAKLEEKLGDAFVKQGRSKTASRIWFENGENHYNAANDKALLSKCIRPHIGFGFKVDCGVILVTKLSRKNKYLYLVDTSYVQKAKIQQKSIVDKHKTDEPDVAF